MLFIIHTHIFCIWNEIKRSSSSSSGGGRRMPSTWILHLFPITLCMRASYMPYIWWFLWRVIRIFHPCHTWFDIFYAKRFWYAVRCRRGCCFFAFYFIAHLFMYFIIVTDSRKSKNTEYWIYQPLRASSPAFVPVCIQSCCFFLPFISFTFAQRNEYVMYIVHKHIEKW